MLPPERGAGVGRAIRQGLRALLLRRPRADLRFDASIAFVLLLPMALLDIALGWFAVAGQYGDWSTRALRALPRVFTPEGSISTLATFAALLLAAWLAALALRRRAALWSLAAPLIVAWIGISLLTGVLTLVVAFNVEDPWAWYQRLRPLYLLAWALVVWRLLAGVSPASSRRFRALALLLAVAVTGGGMWLHAWPDWWQPDFEALSQREAMDESPVVPSVDHEAVIYAQPRLLQAQVGGLLPQRPGTTDFYALGFAGDGHEPVFSYEVRHFEALAANRYDANGRTVALRNDVFDPLAAPLATHTALAMALQAIGARMDADEDVLLLFLTTHGGRDHDLLVQLGELPFDDVGPAELADALEESGIRWRIVIVSACYAGGFVEPLADPYTVVVTAARADRTSFGCGVTSELTWFGKAFLVDGLNAERDPVKAFALASAAIAAREKEEEFDTASEPQIHVGEEIAKRLPGWIAALPPSQPIPYVVPERAAPEPTATTR